MQHPEHHRPLAAGRTHEAVRKPSRDPVFHHAEVIAVAGFLLMAKALTRV
jgi:hypothetical protein